MSRTPMPLRFVSFCLYNSYILCSVCSSRSSLLLLVQVVSADSVCGKSLGFLPRELAQYLSPLIDNYGFGFQVLKRFSLIMSLCIYVPLSS